MTKEGRRKFLGMPEPVLRPCLYSRIDSIPASRKRVVEMCLVIGKVVVKLLSDSKV